MLKIYALLIVLLFAINSQVLARGYRTKHNEWAAEEVVFSKVLAIRAKKLEEKIGFSFDNNRGPRAKFDSKLSDPSLTVVHAQYFYEDQSIHFRSSLIDEISQKYNISLRRVNPAVLAKDDYLGKMIDHELGHLLMDQVSRRNKLGIWYTPEDFQKLSKERQMGVRIVSEGVAVYFAHIEYPTIDTLCEKSFPSNQKEEEDFVLRDVIYDGGYWLVRDILKEHGEIGLLWILRHPFTSTNGNMRKEAVDYRSQALLELTK